MKERCPFCLLHPPLSPDDHVRTECEWPTAVELRRRRTKRRAAYDRALSTTPEEPKERERE